VGSDVAQMWRAGFHNPLQDITGLLKDFLGLKVGVRNNQVFGYTFSFELLSLLTGFR
jgi:hypothetical protein